MNEDDEEDDKMKTDDENEETIEDRSLILTNSSPKVQRLLIYLQQHAQNFEDEIKALIFVKRRYTAKCIYHVIQRFAKALPTLNIRPDFMVGSSNAMPESIEAILNTKCNIVTLDRFKRNEINVIVASSVLEEGIDLQACNLVIAYDCPQTFRSYIQTKGRARMSTSKYVIFTPIAEQTRLSQKLKTWMEVNTILKDVRIANIFQFNETENELFLNFFVLVFGEKSHRS